jgi:hypothetical protein
MPLLDHFHPPLSVARHWESFHARWASAISDKLNEKLLPGHYFAEVQVHVGSRIEVDVGTFEAEDVAQAMTNGGTATAVATMPAKTYAPPAVSFEMPAIFPDSLEVLVYSGETGPTLVSAIELVSPGNKDREDYRHAFAAKCASYLQQGVGLMIIDIVTSRQANLHNELVQLLRNSENFLLAPDTLYASAYRPVRRPQSDKIQVWAVELRVSHTLPELPLALDKGQCVPLDLEAPYNEACQRLRLM